MRVRRATLMVGPMLLAGGWAHANAPHRDPALARGEHVARLVCSACHVVADDEERPL